MDAMEALRTRRSVRKYKPDPVPDELLEQLIDVGRLAATGRNVQPWEFIVVTEAATRNRMAEICEYGKFFSKAPAAIAVFCKDTKYYLEDGSAATQNILVGATALGLGTCWVAGDKKDYCPAIAELLGVPAEYKLVSLIAVGTSAADSPRASKRTIAEVMHRERFGGK